MSRFLLRRAPKEFRRRLEAVQDRLYRMACAWTRDSVLAADLVQEANTKALERAGQLRDLDLFDRWMFRILSNSVRDHFRRRRECVDIDAVEPPADPWTPEDAQHRNEVIHSVRSAIAEMPADHRYVLLLVDLEGFSYGEVANILEIPIGTVMSRVSRARNALRKRLKSDGCQPASHRPIMRRVK